MGNWLGQGSDAISKQRQRFLELAGSQALFVQRSDELDAAMRETETAFGGLGEVAAAELFPALTEVAKAATALISGQHGNVAAWAQEAGAAISGWVKEGGLKDLTNGLREAAGAAAWVYEKVGGMKGMLILTGTYITGGLVVSIWGAVGALWSLGAATVAVAARMALAATASGTWLGYLWMMKGYVWTAIVGHISAATTAIGGFVAAAGSAALAVAPFAAAAVGVAAAGYAIYKNWGDIVEIFTTWQGALNGLKATLDLIIAPLESLRVAGQWWGKALGISGDAARPSLGAAQVAPGVGGAGAQSARVTVDFENVPKGVSVSADPKSTADLDLSMGYSLVGG
jgi:hypothetical protein